MDTDIFAAIERKKAQGTDGVSGGENAAQDWRLENGAGFFGRSRHEKGRRICPPA
jgi:hypothetical protein